MKILDSSPVVAFYSELNNPDLLHKFIMLGYELRIPKGVFGELEIGRTSEKLKSSIREGKIKILDDLTEGDISYFKNRHPYLGKGEIEVILWWLKLKSDDNKQFCVIDDKRARKVAVKYQVVFTGTIGLIDLLLKKQAISQDERKEFIEKLSVSGFRIKGIY